MFNYNHLYYFYVTAKLSGVTAAARQLNTSQPSLSAQIKNLESSLDKQLFRRSGRQMELTEEGVKVYNYCKQMFEIAEELEHYTNEKDALKRVKVSIGVSPEVERPFISNVIGKAIKKTSEKSRPVISITSLPEQDLLKSLKLNKIDVLIADSPINDSDLEVKATYSMPVVFFIAPEIIGDLKISPKDNAIEALKKSSNFLALPASPMLLRKETEQFLHRKKIKFNLVFETDILASLIRSVIDGVSTGLIPLPYILNETRQGILKVISPAEGLWQHKIYVITSKSTRPTIFLDHLLATLETENKVNHRFN